MQFHLIQKSMNLETWCHSYESKEGALVVPMSMLGALSELLGLSVPLSDALPPKGLAEGELIQWKLPVQGVWCPIILYYAPLALTPRGAKALASAIAENLHSLKLGQGSLVLEEGWGEEASSTFLTELYLAMQHFDHFLSKAKYVDMTLALLAEGVVATRVLERSLQVAQCVQIARDLGNAPANVMTPEILAKEAVLAGKRWGFDVEVLDKAAIDAIGMKAFLAVSQGSSQEPKLIVMRYDHADADDRHVALIGKGLTYDSGGYSIKPTDGMLTMKCDMCGSAAVIGAMALIAALKLPVRVTGVVASCENMISGAAYKPGDIISTLAGKTVEVVNTDAEGRLTLADAVYYAHQSLGATHLVDICTLTGACVVALGNDYAGVLTNDETMWSSLSEASQRSGDKLWRMPCDEDYAKLLESPIADLSNCGPRWGGMITAGMFVKAFAGDLPWTHIDIAGPAFADKASAHFPAGASGTGVVYLAEMVRGIFER